MVLRQETKIKSHISSNHYLYISMLIILVLMADSFILVNYQGIYWDDWTLIDQTHTTILNAFSQAGFPITGYLHAFLQNMGNGVFLQRLILVAITCLNSVLLYKILNFTQFYNKSSAFFVSALFVLAPVNNVKIALINLPSNIYVSIFCLGLYSIGRFGKETRQLKYRFFTLLIFYCSFAANSLLVMYYVVAIPFLLYRLNIQATSNDKNTKLPLRLVKILDFLLLPIVFYAIQQTFFKPTGYYVGANDVILNFYDLLSPRFVFNYIFKPNAIHSLLNPLTQIVYTSVKHYWLWFCVTITLLFPLSYLDEKQQSDKNQLLLLLYGFLIFYAGVFPYIAVGKLPRLLDWESRHQLLVPFGFAITLGAGIQLISCHNKNFSTLLKGIILSSLLLGSIHTNYSYLVDWFYQLSIIEKFKTSVPIKNHSTFIVNNTIKHWVNRREFRFYENNGMLKRAFGDEKRLMVATPAQLDSFKPYQKDHSYNFYDWKPSTAITVNIKESDTFKPRLRDNLLLAYYMLFNKKKLNKLIPKLTTISTQKNKRYDSPPS